MSKRTLLDTDVLSALMKAHPAATARAAQYLVDHAKLSLSLITRYEILRGLKASGATTKVAAFNQFCAAHEVLPLSDATVERAAQIYADLRQRGLLIGDADILIAATAIEHASAIATHNTAHFARIAGLFIDDWIAG